MSLPNFSRALSIISRGEAFSRSFANCSKSSCPFSTSVHHTPQHLKKHVQIASNQGPKRKKKKQHRKFPEKKKMWWQQSAENIPGATIVAARGTMESFRCGWALRGPTEEHRWVKLTTTDETCGLSRNRKEPICGAENRNTQALIKETQTRD